MTGAAAPVTVSTLDKPLMQTSSDVPAVGVADRADPPRSSTNTAWPLAALALLLLTLVRACVPTAAVVAPPQALEPAAAARAAGSSTGAASSAPRPEIPPTPR